MRKIGAHQPKKETTMNVQAMKAVYHFTCTARLPWILDSGELRPGRNKIGGFPDPDFLWATTSALGDRSASGSAQGYRDGRVRLVRFALRAEDFTPWPEAAQAFPAWTPSAIARLEKAAAGKSSPTTWRCRAAPLRRDRWLSIETRSYVSKIWRPLPLDTQPVRDGASMGVNIDGIIYTSVEVSGPNGSVGYTVQKLAA
jgi:hypothetical protein